MISTLNSIKGIGLLDQKYIFMNYSKNEFDKDDTAYLLHDDDLGFLPYCGCYADDRENI